MTEPLPKLVVMVGLPRSGKSTVVDRDYLSQGYAVVCPDEVRRAIHGQRFVASAERWVWATVFTMVDALRRRGCRVVVDACNVTREHRKPWVERGATFHVLHLNAQICIDRVMAANESGHLDYEDAVRLEEAIKRMDAAWEAIDPNVEGVYQVEVL